MAAHCFFVACRREPRHADSHARSTGASTSDLAPRPFAPSSYGVGDGATQREISDSGALAADVGSADDNPDIFALPDWSEAALAARVPQTDAPRFYAKTRHVWIYPEPDISLQWVGFLWTGGSVRLKSTRPIYGPGCSFFYAILPWGYICTDANRGTIDPNDRLYRQLLRYSPRTDSPFLHRYGQASQLTRYFAFPGLGTPRNSDSGLDVANLPQNLIDFNPSRPASTRRTLRWLTARRSHTRLK